MIFKNLYSVKQHPRILCPDCSLSMTPFSCKDVIVDRCEKCQGIWFDKKEIAVFRDSLREISLEEIEVHQTPPSDIYNISSCPHCKTMLSEAKLGYNAKESIKKCPRCEGI